MLFNSFLFLSSVTRHSEDITSLEWDISGTRLAIADAFGNLEIWTMKDSLISNWHLSSSFSCFVGEKILASAWFHNGLRTIIFTEKKDNVSSYSEKFIHSNFNPSLRQFGGKSTLGCICVSHSGLVWCVAILSDNSIATGSRIVGQLRSKLKLVDICYAKNGDFLIITSNGSVESSITCYRVSIKLNTNITTSKKKFFITCQPFSSFYLNCSSFEEIKYINSLKFVLKEGSDAVVVGASGPNGSILELWELKEKSVTLYKMFQPKPGSDFRSLPPKSIAWQHSASTSYHSAISSIITPKSSLYDLSSHAYIMVAYKDNTLKCYLREGLKSVFQFTLNSSSYKSNSSSKVVLKSKNLNSCVNNIVDMQFSWSGCILTAVDAISQVFMFRIPPLFADHKTPFSPVFLQTMLEYSIITGRDWWDILVCFKPSMIETVCDMLTDNFNQKQDDEIKSKWLTQLLTIKASLYRCLNSGNPGSGGQVKASDCYTLIMLNAIANLTKSLLRPRVSQEKEGPAENLSNIIQSKINEPQCLNKALLGLEHKDFFVEKSILQSLQHLNQWVGDLSLFLLATLPQQCHNHQRFPGVRVACRTKCQILNLMFLL